MGIWEAWARIFFQKNPCLHLPGSPMLPVQERSTWMSQLRVSILGSITRKPNLEEGTPVATDSRESLVDGKEDTSAGELAKQTS